MDACSRSPNALAKAPEPPTGKAGRRAAWKFGWHAETRAAWWLRFKGYSILARRLRTPAGELDLIAKRGRVLAFVEVKARGEFGMAAEAVSVRQRQRIARAAETFVASHPRHQNEMMRFDVVLVAPGRWPHHLADAWRPDI